MDEKKRRKKMYVWMNEWIYATSRRKKIVNETSQKNERRREKKGRLKNCGSTALVN